MKAARFFSVIFAVVGIVLMLGTCVVCFASVNSSVKILEYPDGAVECSEQLHSALLSGDYPALEQLLYGQPKLGAEGTPDNIYTAMIWDAFLESIRFSYTGNLYLLDADLARDATITVLDIPAVTEKLSEVLPSLLAQKAAAEEAEAGSVSQALVEQTLQEALAQLLQENAPVLTRNVTIKLIRRDGRWWALPDQEFLKAISGLQA